MKVKILTKPLEAFVLLVGTRYDSCKMKEIGPFQTALSMIFKGFGKN